MSTRLICKTTLCTCIIHVQEQETTRVWEVWVDNLIIEDASQKERISFYQNSEFSNIKLIVEMYIKPSLKKPSLLNILF